MVLFENIHTFSGVFGSRKRPSSRLFYSSPLNSLIMLMLPVGLVPMASKVAFNCCLMYGIIFLLVCCCSYLEMVQVCGCAPHFIFHEKTLVILTWQGRDYHKYIISSIATVVAHTIYDSWHYVSLVLHYMSILAGLRGHMSTLASSTVNMKTFRELWLEVCYNKILLLITTPGMSLPCGTGPWHCSGLSGGIITCWITS